MVSKLNIITIGSSPNLLFFASKLDKTGRFNTVVVNSQIDVKKPLYFKTASSKSGKETTEIYEPANLVSSLADFKQANKFDIILISSKSLQEISNLSDQLLKILNETSILIIESSGFVNLEPFIKNCLPNNLKLSIFSIISNFDLRISLNNSNEFIFNNLNKLNEIYLGESSNSNSKYSSITSSNLKNLIKIFQNAINLKNSGLSSFSINTTSTYLEFLTKQWCMAIPKICFEPLLILFEESNPKKLNDKILAKPLISGLITELITVAKTMGCKLPNGYDNESNLLENWENQYSSLENAGGDVKYLNSPKFFYNFFYHKDLDIDMLLLQPILLADDYGIKTPYLEFLYATICQLDKFNSLNDDEKLIFTRFDKNKSIDNGTRNSKLDENEYKRLVNENSILNSKLEVKSSEFNKLFENFNLVKDREMESLNNANLLKNQSNNLINENNKLKLEIDELNRKLNELSSISNNQRGFVQSDGTPDLKDLTDVALISSQLEESGLNSNVVGGADNEVAEINGSANTTIIHSNDNDKDKELSNKEIELKKKEMLLYSKEIELNKKLMQMNTTNNNNNTNINNTNRPQGAQQYYPQPHNQPNAPLKQQQLYNNNNNINNAINNMNGSSRQTMYGQPQQQQQLQPGLIAQSSQNSIQPPQPPQQGFGPRRTQSFERFSVNNDLNAFKKTSRKNRKSSFPINTQNVESLLPSGGNSGNRFRGAPQQVARPVPVHALQHQRSIPQLYQQQQQQQQQQQPNNGSSLNINTNNGNGSSPLAQQPSQLSQPSPLQQPPLQQPPLQQPTPPSTSSIHSMTPSPKQQTAPEQFESSAQEEWKPSGAETEEIAAKPLGGVAGETPAEQAPVVVEGEKKKKKKFGLFKSKK